MKSNQNLAYAMFLINGDAVKPDFWSNYFRVHPYLSVEKGKPFITPSGRMNNHPGRSGVWGVSSDSAVSDPTLDPHIKYLVTHLALPRLDLPPLLSKIGARMYVSCFWSNIHGYRPHHISDELREIIHLSGGTIEVDVDPKDSVPG
jgi:hypothetical protein